MKKTFLIASVAILCGGCASNIKHIGRVGDVDFYRLRERSIAGPNVTAVIEKRGDEVSITHAFSGPALPPSVVQGGAIVGAAALLRPTRINNSTVGTISATGNGGAGGASSQSVTTGGSSTVNNSFVPPGQVNNPGHSN